MTTPQGRTTPPFEDLWFIPGDSFVLTVKTDADGIAELDDGTHRMRLHWWAPTIELGTIGWWESQHRPRSQSRIERLVRRLAGWGPDR